MVDRARFARHLSLQGVGEAGQQRFAAASVVVHGSELAGAIAERYLTRAGVGEVTLVEHPSLARPAWLDDELTTSGAREVAAGSLEALEALCAVLSEGDSSGKQP